MAIGEEHIPGPSWSRRERWREYHRQQDLRLKREREDKAMAEQVTAVTEVLSPQAAAQLRARTEEKTNAVVRQARDMEVTCADGYQDADILLARVRQARKNVESIMEPIIRPIRAGLDKLYALNRELLKPVDEAETVLKSKMAEYKKVEAARIRKEQEEKAAEERRLQREADAKRAEAERARQAEAEAARKAQQAKTEEERRKAWVQSEQFRKQAEEAIQAVNTAQVMADAVAERVVEGPVKGVASKTVVRKVWKITDMDAFLTGIVAEDIPQDAVMVNAAYINALWASDRAMVAGWPGIEVVTETTISGR